MGVLDRVVTGQVSVANFFEMKKSLAFFRILLCLFNACKLIVPHAIHTWYFLHVIVWNFTAAFEAAINKGYIQLKNVFHSMHLKIPYGPQINTLLDSKHMIDSRIVELFQQLSLDPNARFHFVNGKLII